MSAWTHVAAVFRIDAVKKEYQGPRINGRFTPEWDKITGKAIYDGNWCSKDDYEQQRLNESWDDYRKHESRYMPAGSEGSLQRLVWVNPKDYIMVSYTVTVFGDLRDYDDYEEIKKWFYDVCGKCHLRQAVCNCVVAGRGKRTWEASWDGDE